MAISPERPQPNPAEAPFEAGSFRLLLVIFRRRWKLFVLTCLATLAATTVYTVRATKLYRPRVTLEIRPETPLVASDRYDPTALSMPFLWEKYYKTQESILTSTTLHEETLKALPEPIRRQYSSMVNPVAAFSAQVDIEQLRNSFILRVGFIDPDPEKATKIVNTLVSLYLEDANRRLRDLKTGAAAFLSRETLPAIRQKVDEADKAVQRFQAENGFIDTQEQYTALAGARRTILERITQVRLRQMQMRAQIDALSAAADGGTGIYNPIFHGTRVVEILVAQQEQLESELSRQLRELKEEHPAIQELKDQLKRVQTKIQQALRGVLASFESDLAALEQEEKSAVGEQRRIERMMSDTSQRAAQSKRLEAELTASRELYNSYLKKQGEESATSGLGLGSVRIVDHATVPIFPFKPNLFLNIAIGGMIGILLGVAAMFVSEQLDDRIRSPHEIEVILGLDVLSVVPRLGERGSDQPLLLDEQSSIADFETFRSLRAEVTTRLEDIPGPKVVAVLSPMKSEGKSTVSVNLAKVLAMDGRRVLIFDSDMRRPSIVPRFGQSPSPDFERVLRGEATLEESIRPSLIPGVDILGMAKGTSQASELAGSPRFDEVLRKIREGYDFVIVDSAPVNQASESSLIARRCDAGILVLRERRTSRAAAQAADRRVRSMGIRLLGAVLNAVEGPENAYGYYGYYYSYYKPREGELPKA